MNRREAIVALTALPGVGRIEVARLKPEDVIVVECDGRITPELANRLTEYIQRVFGPDQKAIVCEAGVRLKVISKSESPR